MTLNQYLMDERVAAIIDPNCAGGGGLVFVQGGASYEANTPAGVPSPVMAIENYRRLARLLDRNFSVELEIDVRNTFYDSDSNAYNTVAEIPGTDKKDELVMLGAHLDPPRRNRRHRQRGRQRHHHGGDSHPEGHRLQAAPQGSGGAVERRRAGLVGSHAHVKGHFGSHVPTDPKELAMPEWLRKEAKVSAYFNVDNGTGKIRGVYLQENEGVEPIFRACMRPFNDLGMSTLTMRNTGGTDHESFDAVGFPGFQLLARKPLPKPAPAAPAATAK